MPDQTSVAERAARVEALTGINTDDMLGALGLSHVGLGRSILALAVRGHARRLARQVLAYDELVGEQDLSVGSVWLLRQFVSDWSVVGREQLPARGPVLIVSNHPGLYDTTLLFAAIDRPDLRIIAADRPFLRALTNVSRHILYLGDSAGAQLGLIRAAVRHLRQGGAVLTFPGGGIEPDPSVQPGAVEALSAWSESLGLFARLAPGTEIVPAIVSGVLAAGAQRHPLTRLRRQRKDREWLGAMLQIVAPAVWTVTPRVTFGRPVRIPDQGMSPADGPDARQRADAAALVGLRRAVLAEARRLIETGRE